MAGNLLNRGVVDHLDSTASIARSGYPLGVLCRFCLNRALISGKELAERFPKPRSVKELRFRCRRCQRTDVELHKFWSPSSVRRFMRADD